MSSTWQCEYLLMKKLLEELNSYVEVHDWLNARRVSKILQFKLQFEPMYEETRVKEKKIR